jgi:hypothetical protein
VYSVKKENDSYSIINYLTDEIILVDIPFANLAERVCEHYNSNKKLDKEYHKRLKEYYKHAIDLAVYQYNFDKTEDEEIKVILWTRIGVSNSRMKKAKAELLLFPHFLINKY